MLKIDFFSTLFMTVALLVFALLLVPPALAVTFTVNSTLDEPDLNVNDGICSTLSGKCTLRAAVMQANVVNVDTTILVPSGIYILTIPPIGLDGPETGDLNLTTPTIGSPVITIIGAGFGTTIIDGNQLDRVFSIPALRRASISGVTIRNGSISGDGGGIYNGGTLTVNTSTISGNRSLNGGSVFNAGTLTVNQSTISGNNQSLFDGGGVYNLGTLTLSQSTISGNRSGYGGGIYNDGMLTVSNSTISENGANTDGGGIYNAVGIANIYNTSIVFNGADADADPNGGSGGGVYNLAGATFNLHNTLVAGNYVSGQPVYDDCTGTLNSYGRNLFYLVVSCTVNTVSGSWAYLNDLNTLGLLQNNGGPTWTHALLPGSEPIDGGDPVQGCIGPDSLPLATDQRGAARVVGARCDIGAFEYGAQVDQSIQFGPVSNKTLTDSPFVITATSSSDLPVDFSTNTPSVCTVTGGPLLPGVSSATIVLIHAGTCTLVAQQPGNQIFNPAVAVTQTFKVTSNNTFLPSIRR
jgi:hypothetical protein